MSKPRAVIVTASYKVYDDFIKMNRLDRDNYPLALDKEKLHGYKNTIAICLFRWQDVFGDGIEFNHTEALLKNHDVDVIVL